MAQGGGLRTIFATLLVATGLLAAGCDSSKPSDSPVIPVRSAGVPPSTTSSPAPATNLTPSAATPTAVEPAPSAGPTVPPTAAPVTAAPSVPSETASPTPSAVASAIAALDAADLADEDSLHAVDAIRFTTAGRDAARAILEQGSGNASRTWAAIIVYAGTGNDPAPLRPFVADHNLSVAVLAAATLVAFGDASGFHTLQRLLPSEQLLAGSHPPIRIGDFALSTLERYVHGEHVPTVGPDQSVDAYLAAWSTWLDSHAADLAFNPASGTWVVP